MRPLWFLLGFISVVVVSCGAERGLHDGYVLRVAGQRFIFVPGAEGYAAAYELTREEWAAWLQSAQASETTVPGLKRDAQGRWAAERGTARLPATHLSQTEARAYCAWFSLVHGVKARLPSEAEWEIAARGGLSGTRFSWGWEPPQGRAHFAKDGPAPVGGLEANRLGLHDACGNVWEWCEEPGRARGGGWSERNEGWVSLDARHDFGPEYRDADVGLRLWVEPAGSP